MSCSSAIICTLFSRSSFESPFLIPGNPDVSFGSQCFSRNASPSVTAYFFRSDFAASSMSCGFILASCIRKKTLSTSNATLQIILKPIRPHTSPFHNFGKGGLKAKKRMNRTGLEPVTSSVSWRRASQLRQRSVQSHPTAFSTNGQDARSSRLRSDAAIDSFERTRLSKNCQSVKDWRTDS